MEQQLEKTKEEYGNEVAGINKFGYPITHKQLWENGRKMEEAEKNIWERNHIKKEKYIPSLSPAITGQYESYCPNCKENCWFNEDGVCMDCKIQSRDRYEGKLLKEVQN